MATTAALPRWKGKDLFVSEMPAEGWRQLARSTKQAGDVGLLCGLQAAYAEKRDEKYDKVFKIFIPGWNTWMT